MDHLRIFLLKKEIKSVIKIVLGMANKPIKFCKSSELDYIFSVLK